MKPIINMNYRFIGNDEPTDEQLLVIMQEVRANVIRKNNKLKSIITENIQREYRNARAMFPNL